EFEYINSNMYFTDNMYNVPLINDIEEDLVSDKILEEISLEFDGFDGEYGSYFPNFTSAALYVWNTKFTISTSTYEDLVKIITHSKFRKDDVPFVLTSTKKAFTISLLEHLERILNNPAITSKLYFSPGIIKNEKSEFWHRSLWQESLLFGSHEIKSDSRENNKELWLVEGDSVFVDSKNISQHVNVWFSDLPEPDNYNFYVQEYHDISTRYRIPCESVMLKTPPQPMSIYK
ncbi:7733_t:CDS:2, partial [Cetraspora pellucida]